MIKKIQYYNMVAGLTSYVNKNISPLYKKWKLNKEIYELIDSNENLKNQNVINENVNKENPLYIIIDGPAYFYFLSEKINWLNFDSLEFINILRKVCNDI